MDLTDSGVEEISDEEIEHQDLNEQKKMEDPGKHKKSEKSDRRVGKESSSSPPKKAEELDVEEISDPSDDEKHENAFENDAMQGVSKEKDPIVGSQVDSEDAPEPSPEAENKGSEVEEDDDDNIEIISFQELPDTQKYLRKRRTPKSQASKKRKISTQEAEDDDIQVPESADFDSESAHPESESESDDSFADASSELHKSVNTSDIGSPTPDIPDAKLPKVPEVIELDSESDSEHTYAPPKSLAKGLRSPIHLLTNPSYGLSDELPTEVNTDTVTIAELVGQQDLLETYQFNFNVDLEYFLTFPHSNFAKNRRKIVFITGSPILGNHPLRDLFRKAFDISEAVAPLPNRYASHHSKMMINVFESGEIEIVIMTCNLTQLDFGGLTQAVWRSGRLKKGKTTSKTGKRFRIDLLRYLSKYGLSVTKTIIKRIDNLDYSSVEVELVASAPGKYSLEDIGKKSEAYGYAKLRQVLERNLLLIEDTNPEHKFLAQVTSIAYPYTSKNGQCGSVFSHLLCPLIFKDWLKQLDPGAQSFESHQTDFNYSPQIMFPTTKDIAHSNFGFLSGSAVHFKCTKSTVYGSQYEQNIRKYLYKWGASGDSTGRERVTPHVKYYACDNGDNWESLKWVLVGSHNLSKQAWGYPVAKSGGTEYQVDSFELSVLVPGKHKPLIPVYGKDVCEDQNGTPVRFPFVVPPTKYDKRDQPWSVDVDCGKLKDRWGNEYHGSYL